MSNHRDKIIEHAEMLNFPDRLHFITSLAKWLSEDDCKEFCDTYTICKPEKPDKPSGNPTCEICGINSQSLRWEYSNYEECYIEVCPDCECGGSDE